MWMSPQWFQTHQLRNVSSDYCATINCYRYDTQDIELSMEFREGFQITLRWPRLSVKDSAGAFNKEKALE